MEATGRPVLATAISVIIADDHEFFLDGLSGAFASQDKYALLAACKDGDHLLRAAHHHQPDVIVTDLKMPGTHGAELIKKLKEISPESSILILTVMDHEFTIVQALEAGGIGYILKDSSRTDLFDAIESANRGIPYYCRSTTRKLVRLISNSLFNPYDPSTKSLFTETEREIITMMCEDKSVKEMSAALFLSERTIEKHRSSVFNKMNVKTVAGVAIYAIKNNLYLINQQK